MSIQMGGASLMAAADLNNEANRLEALGDFAGAEKNFKEALAMKIHAQGDKSIGVALTKNALGELYLTMSRLDEAQKMLEEADEIRSPNNDFDAAVTRDNLGQLWEMRGNFVKAREVRERGTPNRMICSNFHCPKSAGNVFSSRSDLGICARCKSTFYCPGAQCQKQDWKARHKKYCKQV